MARQRVEKNISYDAKRKLYYVTLYYGNVDGKPQKETETFSTKREARERLKRFEYEKSVNLTPRLNGETVKSWVEYTLEEVMKPQVEQTTYSGYKNISRRVVSELGGIELRKLTAKDIQMYLNTLTDPAGKYRFSNNTAIKHLTFLKTVLESALKQQLISRNPAYLVEAPKRIEPEISFYTPEQINRLFEVINKDTILKPAGYLAAMLGLRREEICGLQWENVDLVNRVIYVRHARTIAGSSIVDKDTKNYSSTRKLYIDDILYGKLKEIRQEQLERAEIAGNMYMVTDYVEVGDFGKPVNPGYLSSRFRKCVIDNGLPHITLHGLRHSVASIANAAGMTQYDISKMLGHSTPAVTGKVYTHLFDDVQVKSVSRVAQMIETNKKKNDK
ncbi:MAG: tyrosine-type recombinase/integrase [Clostridiales bacterium]|nr:tyrosine-type recombinase/integrase [Clostridiales bacterium]